MRRGGAALVESAIKYGLLRITTCCLRCGRTEGIGKEDIETCEDCVVMSFSID